MDLQTLVRTINSKLAGEQLTFEQLKTFLDDTIFDINSRLNSKYPAFSDFNNTNYPEEYPNYNFFPDKYIRSVVVIGAAYKFYVTDEEGINTAPRYGQEYARNLFYMERDFINQVPETWRETGQGYIDDELDNLYSSSIPQTFW